MKPTPAKPSNIIAQVDNSGTADTATLSSAGPQQQLLSPPLPVKLIRVLEPVAVKLNVRDSQVMGPASVYEKFADEPPALAVRVFTNPALGWLSGFHEMKNVIVYI